MRCILLGIFICALASTAWGKPLESTTTASTTSTEKSHGVEPGKPLASTPAPEKKTAEGPHSEATTTKKPEPLHATDEKKPTTTPKTAKDSTQKLNEKEVKTSTVKPHVPEPKATSTAAKGNKEAITQKSEKKEEPKHKSGEIESQIDDFISEGKTIVFNGVCGPEGCAVKGDVYDDLPPLMGIKK